MLLIKHKVYKIKLCSSYTYIYSLVVQRLFLLDRIVLVYSYKAMSTNSILPLMSLCLEFKKFKCLIEAVIHIQCPNA
jgi:hypothetical protein